MSQVRRFGEVGRNIRKNEPSASMTVVLSRGFTVRLFLLDASPGPIESLRGSTVPRRCSVMDRSRDISKEYFLLGCSSPKLANDKLRCERRFEERSEELEYCISLDTPGTHYGDSNKETGDWRLDEAAFSPLSDPTLELFHEGCSLLHVWVMSWLLYFCGSAEVWRGRGEVGGAGRRFLEVGEGGVRRGC